jgi:rhodanese-related sulfurtransferase
LKKAHVVSYQNLSNHDFKERISDNPKAVIIDVRTPEEIANGKIEGAMEINWHDKDFAKKIFALDKEKEYYLYCKVGGRSAKAARLMIKNGFGKVFNLGEGYQSWVKEPQLN